MTANSDWRHRAACRGEDPELWFPLNDAEHGPAVLQAADAVAICHGCPAIKACLAWALETSQGFGVWGGMTAPDRARLKRREIKSARRATGGAA
jgi:WhiB family redox-sensing transcriptional regulator